ncbi:MAG: ribose 5-phosphate isomerase B [Bacteroidetes bacterium]|nr:MAG: ribose 5-phosphate isomerase B [Bacteroidota bacterium]
MSKTPDKIAIASDHAGFALKQKIKSFLHEKGIESFDFGTHSEESVDYPDYVHPLAQAMGKGDYELGIVICGSGNGVNITANKHAHIRSALCWIPEIATLARHHNDANVLAMPARFIDEKLAREITEAFLDASFEGGRHKNRVDKIKCS